MDAIGTAARSIKAGETELMIAGGIESMTRAPICPGESRFGVLAQRADFDTTIGWRFVNPEMRKQYGTHSMPETADNVAVRL
jgi:acetyl-CoA acetyltransferase